MGAHQWHAMAAAHVGMATGMSPLTTLHACCPVTLAFRSNTRRRRGSCWSAVHVPSGQLDHWSSTVAEALGAAGSTNTTCTPKVIGRAHSRTQGEPAMLRGVGDVGVHHAQYRWRSDCAAVSRGRVVVVHGKKAGRLTVAQLRHGGRCWQPHARCVSPEDISSSPAMHAVLLWSVGVVPIAMWQWQVAHGAAGCAP